MNVFDLFAKISLDTRDYEKNLGDAKSKFSGFADGLKSAVGKVGKILTGIGEAAAAGVTAASTALTALTKQTLDAVGDFEQLEGGAKKIFDEMDFEKISRDAQNAYKELNMSASEYLESINLAGATFAQTMGDEKGYDTARKGMLAIADFASGTGKNLTELNQKFQLITRSASGYQSIADQFAGILPQTSADFLEAAKAAGLLKNEYEELKDVPVAEYQQAVTEMLVKGVDQLGLSQNTLIESTQTLTGSFAMAKAAWKNFMTGAGDTKTFVDALKSAIDQTRGKLSEIIPRLTTGLTELVDLLAPEIPPIIEQTLPTIIDAASTLLTSLAQRLPGLLTTLAEPLATGTIRVVQGLIKILPDIGKAIVDICKKGFDFAMTNMNEIVAKAVEVVTKVLKFVTDPSKVSAIVHGALDLIKAFVGAMLQPEGLLALADGAASIIENLVTDLVDSAGSIIDAAIEILGNLVDWFFEDDNLVDLLAVAVRILTALKDGLVQSIGIVIEKVWTLAEQIADAFGVGDYWRAGKKSIEDFKDGVAAAYEECKEFFEGVGERIYEDLHPESKQSAQDILTQSLIDQNAPQAAIAQQRGAQSGEPTYFVKSKTATIPHNIAEEYEMRYRHAKGFYANRPTLLTNDIVGESGSEVLLPLESNTEWMDKLAAKIGGGGVHIENLTVDVHVDELADDYSVKQAVNSMISEISEQLAELQVRENRGIGLPSMA